MAVGHLYPWLSKGTDMPKADRKALYAQHKIPYCEYCVETDDWSNHRAHKLYREMDDEQINDAHNTNIMNVGYCLTCGSTDATNGICGVVSDRA